MILAFTLSMPGCASWNGRWSGEGKMYGIVKTFRTSREIENALKICEMGYYRYSWSDGWAAGITVKQVSPNEASKIRKSSNGFCGYDWMVDSIIKYGEPLATHQIEDFINSQKNAAV